MKKRFGIRTVVVSCLVCVLATAALLLSAVAVMTGSVGGVWDVLKYAHTIGIIEKNYIGETDLGTAEEAGYRALVGALDDRWSYYMNPEEYEAYKQYSKNTYTGVGITLQIIAETGEMKIVSVIEGSPAEKAGIAADDVLLAVDGASVTGMTISEVRGLIQARHGQEIVLTVRTPVGDVRDVRLRSETIFNDPVSYKMLESGLGYISIENFENGCADGVKSAVRKFMEEGAAGLIFDVRDNPGGKVSQLLDILDFLLPEGDIFISVDKNGREKVHTSNADCIELPMAILVNANTYSAAEFFAAALQEYDWAIVVGEQTTGKGRSQITVSLPDGSAIHISNNVYLTPNRVDLSKAGGVTPDIEEGNEGAEDRQLSAAVSALS
ncbi:MAG: S41 family peptidase [Oscillospiraceae bacterium]